MRKVLVVVVVGMLFFVGCGDDKEETTGGSSNTTTMENMPGMTTVPEAGQAAAATCDVDGQTLKIVAQDTKFDRGCLAAPGEREFLVQFENKDSTNHSFAIVRGDNSNDVIAKTEIFSGPKTVQLTVPGQPAGTYSFHCEVHPNVMKGTFVVK